MQQSVELADSLLASWRQIAVLLPRIGIAIALLLVGWLVARTARRLVIRLARLLRLDAVAEWAGIEGFLLQGGVEFTAVSLVGGAVYWLVFFLTFATVLDTLAVSAGTDFVDRLVRFIPNIVVIVIVLILGAGLARVVGSVTYAYLNNIGSKGADAIAALARYATLVFAVALVVEQLAIRSEILVSAFQIAFAAFCLAMALAFGIGGREWAARILDRFFRS